MNWKPFKFGCRPARRPFRRKTLLRVEELEPRMVLSTDVTAYHPASPATPAPSTTTNPAGGLDFTGGFAGSSGVLTYNGSATINGASAELTDGGVNEAGSVFSTNAVNIGGFSNQFTFQLLNPNADGFTFAIQGDGPTALGPSGGGLGYGPDHPEITPGIAKSVAVKFDLFDNAGEGTDSTGEFTDGAPPTTPAIDLSGTGIDLHSGDVFLVAMGYDGTTLNVTITDTKTKASASQAYTVNIPQVIGSQTGHVGFTGGTGGQTAVQNILTWDFSQAPPTLTGLSTSAAAEGSASFTLTVNGTGFDSTATVQWNGTPLTTRFKSATQLEAVVPASLMREEGTATLSVTEDTGTSGGLPFSITDAALGSLIINPLLPTEGKGIGLIRVATFHDSNRAAPASDFTATITWGDGGTTTLSGAAGNIVALGNGNFAMMANHTFAEEGNSTLSVQISDVGGASLSGSRAVGVADARLFALGLFNPHTTEGKGTGTFTVATFADLNAGAPAADFTAVVHWGDGGTTTVTGSGIVSLGGGKFAVLAGHTYADEGTRTLSVQVRDVGGASVAASLGITVKDAPLVNLSVKNPHATAAQDTGTFTVATFHDNNLGAPTTDFTATVNWGDGTSSTITAAGVVSLGNGDFAVLADHTYAAQGTFTLSIQVGDVGAASINGRLKIAVAGA